MFDETDQYRISLINNKTSSEKQSEQQPVLDENTEDTDKLFSCDFFPGNCTQHTNSY